MDVEQSLSTNHSLSMRSWIEISKSAFFYNINCIDSKHQQETLTLHLNGNAYGHGIENIAILADQHLKIKNFCVPNETTKIKLETIVKKNITVHEHLTSEFLPFSPSLISHQSISSKESNLCINKEVYGLIPPLKPLLFWKTKILRFKKIPPKMPVGYGRTFITSRPTLLGVLPLGYADGLPRLASNKAYVLINNQKAPIVGLISMNLTTVDLTDISDINELLAVEIISSNYNLIDQLALSTNTLPLEITSRLPDDISRFIVT